MDLCSHNYNLTAHREWQEGLWEYRGAGPKSDQAEECFQEVFLEEVTLNWVLQSEWESATV